jgi:hypothetical protein
LLQGEQIGWRHALLPLAWLALSVMVAVGLAEVPLTAQTKFSREGRSWVEETSGRLPQAQNLHIETGLGNITIQGGASEARYVIRKRSLAPSAQGARRDFQRFRISVSKLGEAAFIHGVWTEPKTPDKCRLNADVLLLVPREMNLVLVDTRRGNITVTSTNAKLDLDTHAGAVSVDDASGIVRVRTMGGNVTIGRVGGDLFIHSSGGGDLRVGYVRGRVEVSSRGGNMFFNTVGNLTVQAAGNIEVQHCLGDLSVRTVGGSVTLGDIGGSATIENGGGNIRLGSVGGRVNASTTGGNIEMWRLGGGAQAVSGNGTITAEFRGSAPASFQSSYLRTNSGDIVVYLDRSTQATVQASSELALGSRGIRSDFPELKISSEGTGPGPRVTYAEGAVNGGGPMLKVQTTVGQIDFRRSK